MTFLLRHSRIKLHRGTGIRQRPTVLLPSVTTTQPSRCLSLLAINPILHRVPAAEQRAYSSFGIGEYEGFEKPKPSNWERRNEIIYPIQKEGEPRRMAEIYHERKDIKYSWLKMWYICDICRGLWVDEAIRQLTFIQRKGARMGVDILTEARQRALDEGLVEFASDMHVAKMNSVKGKTTKWPKLHGKGKIGLCYINYTNVYLMLKEGPPPRPDIITNKDRLEEKLRQLRSKKLET